MTGTAMITLATNGDHCQVRGLQLDGGDATSTTGIRADITSQTGFTTGSDACLILDNLLLRRIPGDGITMTGPYNRDAKLTRIQVWQATGRGIHIDCWDGSASMVIAGDSGSHGIMLDTTADTDPPPLAGADDWSHWEHSPNNNPVSADTAITAGRPMRIGWAIRSSIANCAARSARSSSPSA